MIEGLVILSMYAPIYFSLFCVQLLRIYMLITLGTLYEILEAIHDTYIFKIDKYLVLTFCWNLAFSILLYLQ